MRHKIPNTFAYLLLTFAEDLEFPSLRDARLFHYCLKDADLREMKLNLLVHILLENCHFWL